MCSSQGLCRNGDRPPNRSSVSGGSSSGSHYALCALAVGLIALGIVMIVWTVMPLDGEESDNLPIEGGNSTMTPDTEDDEEAKEGTKTSSVAYVLIGAGVVLLLLSICLAMRNKRRAQNRATPPATVPYMDHVTGEREETADDPTTLTVPSYEEVISTGQYPVRESNLRQSTSQLPSYEDIIAAVEADGAEPNNNPPANSTPSVDDPPPAAAEPPPDTGPTNQPTRSSSRASRILRPLRVRRIKSDKLHLKDFRLHIRSPTQNPVTIEPITPPPQYDDKMPELG